MIITWMLSLLLFTILLALAAWCAEVALRLSGRQRRAPWLAALGAAVTWPVLAPLARRAWPASDALNLVAVRIPGISIGDGSVSSAPWLPSLDQLAISAWVVLSTVLLVRLARSLMMLSRVRVSAQRKDVDGTAVLVSPAVGPAIVGVVTPQIMLPESLLDLDEPLRRLVLRHEEEHRSAHDQWIVVASAVILALLPWNVALWWVVRRARLALEIDCDMRVLSAGVNANQYGKLLLFIAQRQSMTALAPMLAASTSHLERRIIAMREPIPARRSARIAVALAGMTLAVVAACTSDVGNSVTPNETRAPTATPVAVNQPYFEHVENAARVPTRTQTIVGIIMPRDTRASTAKPVAANQPYFEFQVEKAARQISTGSSIKYPPELRAAKVSGVVLAQFVVGVDGMVEPGSFTTLKSDHAQFTQAVTDALPGMRFQPADVGGKKVRQLVQQPFTFSLSK